MLRRKEGTPVDPFEGELIRLRAYEPGDEDLLYHWFNDADVTRHLTVRYPVSHHQERDFIEAHHAIGYDNASFAVVTKDGERLIGGVTLRDLLPASRSADLGITIGDKSHWDGGYGTDTMRTICRFGFEMMNLHRIELSVHADNARAIHVYEKVGFRHEGRRRDAVYKFGGYIDALVLGLLEGELQ